MSSLSGEPMFLLCHFNYIKYIFYINMQYFHLPPELLAGRMWWGLVVLNSQLVGTLESVLLYCPQEPKDLIPHKAAPL